MELTVVRFIGNLLVVSAMTLPGCAHDGDKQRAMTQDTPTSKYNIPESAVGYPYPSEDLWRRLVYVFKTPPDELSHNKLGQIFGVEFDEDKMLWYGDKALRKYFLLSTSDIRNIEAFRFYQISLTQGAPDPSATVRKRYRHMAFRFEPFERKYLGTSEIYCIKPKFPDLDALGYRYDKVASNQPQRPDSYGNMPWIPYRTEIFIGAADRGSIGFKQINLQVYPNGCLVGISYFNSPAY
jgi:hypothetical protein